MEKAGLNVGLMYGGQGQGGQIMNPGGSASGGNIEGRNGLSGMGMQLGADLALKIAQTKNIEADTKKKESETQGQNLANNWEDLLQGKDIFDENGHSLKERRYRIEVNELLNKIAKGEAEINKIDKQLLQIGVDMRKGESEIERIKQDTQLIEQLKKFREEMNPIELERVKKELEVYKQNPNNNKVVQWIQAILGIGKNAADILK